MEEKNNMPLASEMYADLKETNMFLRKLLVGAFIVIALLVAGLICTNIYHIHKWSEFDTAIIDSGESGNAIYSHRDNSGGIYNGADSSENPQERQEEIQRNES